MTLVSGNKGGGAARGAREQRVPPLARPWEEGGGKHWTHTLPDRTQGANVEAAIIAWGETKKLFAALCTKGISVCAHLL